LREVVFVANLDRVAQAFGGDQRSECTLAPSRSISASLLNVAAQTTIIPVRPDPSVT
jgi:hypothetical protein